MTNRRERCVARLRTGPRPPHILGPGIRTHVCTNRNTKPGLADTAGLVPTLTADRKNQFCQLRLTTYTSGWGAPFIPEKPYVFMVYRPVRSRTGYSCYFFWTQTTYHPAETTYHVHTDVLRNDYFSRNPSGVYTHCYFPNK